MNFSEWKKRDPFLAVFDFQISNHNEIFFQYFLHNHSNHHEIVVTFPVTFEKDTL